MIRIIPLVWMPRFERKCANCGKEFQTKVTTCDQCGCDLFIVPDPSQLPPGSVIKERENDP